MYITTRSNFINILLLEIVHLCRIQLNNQLLNVVKFCGDHVIYV